MFIPTCYAYQSEPLAPEVGRTKGDFLGEGGIGTANAGSAHEGVVDKYAINNIAEKQLSGTRMLL
jgi:hypothetical protein